MSSKTKSGIGAGGALAVFVAVVLGAGFLYGLVKKNPSDDRSSVLFTVTFDPSGAKRVTKVEIVVLLNGAQIEQDSTKTSPWTKLVPVRRGQTATVIARQTVPSKLSCAVNGEVQESTVFTNPVVCTHKRA